jgi:type II secretory ATPase GspE/PulE/Tfp pilus assembly ATPase PilB-like protein
MSSTPADFPLLKLGDQGPEEAVTALLEEAVKMGASDLFFAAYEDHVAVQVRHLGILRRLSDLPRELGRHCVGHVKAMAGMDVVEHRRPLDGRWLHPLAGGNRVDLRVNVLPTLHGEDCSIRLLGRDLHLRTLDRLGMTPRELADVRGMLASPGGLILVTGPTGSGKTTTLYACLDQLNNGERKINTIEDPIEYELAGTRQSQVNPKLGLGFPDLLRSVLRQSPDVIMVGEIRDQVTAVTAVHAANSGHLVLATTHSPSASTAMETLRAWGVQPHFLASSLLGVIAQRLVRSLCPQCRTPVASPDLVPQLEEIRPLLAEGAHQLWTAEGCPDCHRTGYAGRTGVFEVLPITPALRRLIAEGHPTHTLRDQAVLDGLIELRRAALHKVLQGLTTFAEVTRAVPGESLRVGDAARPLMTAVGQASRGLPSPSTLAATAAAESVVSWESLEEWSARSPDPGGNLPPGG